MCSDVKADWLGKRKTDFVGGVGSCVVGFDYFSLGICKEIVGWYLWFL